MSEKFNLNLKKMEALGSNPSHSDCTHLGDPNLASKPPGSVARQCP